MNSAFPGGAWVPTDIDNDFYGALLCPLCGGNNLHHGTVEVFTREREDAKVGTHVIATGFGRHYADQSMEDNPSSRRDGLTIRFWCENCGLINALMISQHKGTTYVGWTADVVGDPYMSSAIDEDDDGNPTLTPEDLGEDDEEITPE